MRAVVELMKTISCQTNAPDLYHVYADRLRDALPGLRRLSLSRRGLEQPRMRITRSSTWEQQIDPWKDKKSLPLIEGGFLSELIYGDEPVHLQDFEPDPSDPAYEYLKDMGSIAAIPLYEKGEGINMVILMSESGEVVPEAEFPQFVWMSNLFGRAIHSLILSEEVKAAHDRLDLEHKTVADIQLSLLPAVLPSIPNLELAAHYQTASQAGGDYYDIFQLEGGRWGILIADVSGHGSPAAVLMAVMHSLAHSHPEKLNSVGGFFEHINRNLCARYTGNGSYLTAFYGIYDPGTRRMTYASAGHPAPACKSCRDGKVAKFDSTGGFPLGLIEDASYQEAEHSLTPGDQLILYTDGLIEAEGKDHDLFGEPRLHEAIDKCGKSASELIESVLGSIADFTNGQPLEDDLTLLVATVS
jgi:sigma-B regulation protein RsbU (phosphoserine phosphatase)